MRKTRVLVVDDSPAFLSQVSGFLGEFRGVEVVGVASSGEQALEALASTRPDLVLVDQTMPGIGGLEATRRMANHPSIKAVVVMSIHEDATSRAAALGAGARGFLPKSSLVTSLPPLLESLFPTPSSDGAAD